LFSRKIIDFSEIGASLSPFQKSEKDKKEEEVKMVDETLVKSVESKISQPLYDVNIRVLISSPSKDRVDDLMQELRNGFAQLSTPILNLIELKKVKGSALKDLTFKYIYRMFDSKTRIVLNSSEINSF
jgi:hypothetical protein